MAVDAFMPAGLKCEYCECPVGIDTPDPTLGWLINTNQKGYEQNSYRILVASASDLVDQNCGDLWDSGEVLSSEQSGIKYEGIALTPFSRYWWKVMVWDKERKPSCWSEASWFVTGVFKVHQWKAEYFRTFEYKAYYARKEFIINTPLAIESACLFIAARGDKFNSFLAQINGRRIGTDAYCPGPVEYFRMLYRGYDVTDRLTAGTNVLNLVYTKTVSAILRIFWANGEITDIITDSSWKGNEAGPYVRLGYPQGMHRGKFEEYDARLEFEGWERPGFDDGNWVCPVKNSDDVITWGPLFLKFQYVGCGVSERIRPVSIRRVNPDKQIVDFGVNSSGFPGIMIKGQRGQTITLRMAEKLLPDESGLNFTSYGETRPYIKYILKGNRTESYEPCFMYTSFRYLEIEGCSSDLREEDVWMCFLHSEVEGKSTFRCSDSELNLLNSCIRRSFLSNLVNLPTDCPGRERRGWTGDSFSVAEAECLNFNMLRFFYRWFDDMVDCQRGNGWIPVELPLSTDENIDIVWPINSAIIPWVVYEQYGDRRFLMKYWNLLKKYLVLLEENSDEQHKFCDAMLSYGDWLAFDPASKGFIGMAYYFHGTSLAARIAAELGFTDEADHYAKLSAGIRSSINRLYLHSDKHAAWYDGNSQSANAHALYFRICPEELKGKVLKSLVADIMKRNTNTTGFLGTMCIIPALAENGYPEVAYKLITNPNLGGWLYMVKNFSATTLPEFYDGRGSMNHAFLGGAPGVWFYKYLAGISPLKPGYREFKVMPYFAEGIEHVYARLDTLYGTISVSWRERGQGYSIVVNAPPNTKAVVVLCEAEKYAAACDDQCCRFEMVDGKIVAYFGSGKYRIAVSKEQKYL